MNVVRVVEDGPGWRLEPVRDYQATYALSRRFDTQAHAKRFAKGLGLAVEEQWFGMTICDVIL